MPTRVEGAWVKGPTGAWVKADAIVLVGVDEVDKADSPGETVFQVIAYVGDSLSESSMGVAFDECATYGEAEDSALSVVYAIQAAGTQIRASRLTRDVR